MRKFLGRKYTFENEEVDLQTKPEKEFIIWAKFKDLNQIVSYDWGPSGKDPISPVKQRQVTIYVDKNESNFVAGKIRVRELADNDGVEKYVLTLKQDYGPDKGYMETNLEATQELFVQMAGIASEMVIKHRYYIPLLGEEGVWEVDLAPDGKGGYQPWARVEIEVDDLSKAPPKLPFDTEEEILPVGFGELNEETWKEKTDELFDTYFVKKGPLVGFKK